MVRAASKLVLSGVVDTLNEVVLTCQQWHRQRSTRRWHARGSLHLHTWVYQVTLYPQLLHRWTSAVRHAGGCFLCQHLCDEESCSFQVGTSHVTLLLWLDLSMHWFAMLIVR
jgi:hypothetical protein